MILGCIFFFSHSGPFLCSKYACEHLQAQAGSSIINIASTRALMSEPHCEPYAASKSGLLGLTHSLAMSLGQNRAVPKQSEATTATNEKQEEEKKARHVVRVNSICPGWIDVPLHHHVLSESDHAFHPSGRVGGGRDIAQMCLFLADAEKSGFITGQNFVVDGGVTKKMIYDADFTAVGTK
jgi:hypothetical protein